MASEFTTNYNIDLYANEDRPNLRDQYNSAMRKIDAQLQVSADNITVAIESANQAKSATETVNTKLDEEVQARTTADTDLETKIEAEAQARIAADTALESKITAAETNLNTKITAETQARTEADSTLTTNINNVSTNVQNLGTTVTKLSEKIDNININSNPYILCFGDSLTHHTQGANYFWPSYLQDIIGGTVQNFAVGGQGFVNNNGGTFLSQLNNAISSTTDKDKVTAIIVAGGYNDHSVDATAEYNAVSNFVSTAKQNFKNAKVYVAPMLKGVNPLDTNLSGTSDADSIRSDMIEYITTATLDNDGLVCEAPWTWLMGQTQYNFDGVHVNDAGQKRIAEKFYQVLNGQDPTPSLFKRITTATQDGVDKINVLISAVNGIINVSGYVHITKTIGIGKKLFTLPEWAYITTNFANYSNFAIAGLYSSSDTNAAGSRVYCSGKSIDGYNIPGAGDVYVSGSWPQGI